MDRKILVSYDGSASSKKAIEEAKIQASLPAKAEVHIISVVTPGIKSNDTAIAGNISMSDAEFLLPGLQQIKKEMEASGIVTVTDIRTDFSQSNPGKSICEYALANDIDLIIVGHRGISNIKSLLLGSVSNTIVQNAKCPVLIVK